eukprot:TRINITY_DN1170_c0_g1_i4.p1 TRINITY_DN1170_c0_g1~~TRINITY_DN1170_c0_g1_i4.p1  ORF type:complete len:394 (-),score=60.75 TRINITY_DN1170_c0_g1_i4:239-1420(-)
MFQNNMERIVSDDAVASQRLPSVDLKDLSSPSKSGFVDSRCDSGFNSGLSSGLNSGLVHPYNNQLSELKVPTTSHPKFDRLDSGYDCGISSDFESLTLKSPIHQNRSGDSPTQIKPQQQNNEDFRQLYEADKDGDCQLHLAIASGFTEVVFALIRMAPHPAYLDIQNNELYAPLHIAVLMNQPNMVRRLVVAGATNDIRDQEGNTPLHLASKRGYLECAEALLRSISVEELKDASVVSSDVHNNLRSILDLKNYHGEHSIHLATFGQHYNFIRFLSWSGADMNATEGRSGKTALHYAVNKRDLNLVGLLSSQKSLGGCEVYLNHRDWAGRTPIQCATINGDLDIVTLLKSLPNCDSAQWESDEDFEFDTDEAEDEVDITYNDIEVSRVLESRA